MGLFEKVIKKTQKHLPIENQSDSLTELPYSSLSFFTKRGFLAMKLSKYLNLEKENKDYLLYQSIFNSQFLEANFETEAKDFSLYLSDLMLKWHDHDLDIPSQIKSTEFSNDVKNGMLKAFQIYQEDLFFKPINNPPITPFNNSKDREWEIYRDVIYAATQGQFLLISDQELEDYKKGKVFCEGEIKERSDIPTCRNLAKESLEVKGYIKSKIMGWILVLSEAITNTIKHAEEGKMTLIECEEKNEVRFIIEDKGPGFPIKDLPKSTLFAGYSTKNSMGQGFTLMMKMAKRVLLYTTSTGSTLILVFDSSKEGAGSLNATS